MHVHASLWEAEPEVAPRGYNTAICVAPDGGLVAHTRKLHIPVTAGYYEDQYFAEGVKVAELVGTPPELVRPACRRCATTSPPCARACASATRAARRSTSSSTRR